jgi:hypothetical protein
MTFDWTDRGAISTPPAWLAYGAAAAILGLSAFALYQGAQLGARPREHAAVVARVAATADDGAPTVEAKPLAQAQAASDDEAGDLATDKAVQAPAPKKTPTRRHAAAQKAPSDNAAADHPVDATLAAPTEKANAPAKPALAEAPPAAPVKSDVPF